MWWPPRTEREFDLARAMDQLRNWFREQPYLDGQALSWGFGTMWSHNYGGLVPLVLLNEERFPYPFLTHAEQLGPRGLLEPIEVAALRDRGPEVRFPRTYPPLHYLSVAQPRASSVADELFGSVLSVRDPVVCGRTGEMGTAGVVVRDITTDARYLLTAGHVFPKGVGSPVRRARWRLMRFRWTTPLGEVIRHIVPDATSGWDSAVIRVDKQLPFGVRVVRNQLRHFETPNSVVAYGAFSGLVRNAVVHGGLEALPPWKNCWICAPSGILTHGDSGAGVFTRSERKFLGVYVAQEMVGGRVAIHYVQDSYTLEQQVLKNWNIEF